MRYTKILTLLAAAVVATVAFAGTASATSLTTTTGGGAETPTIHLVNEGGHVSLADNIATIECSSTVVAAIEDHGVGVAASGNVSNLEFTACTNGWTVEVNAKGSLSVSWTSGHDGTVSSTGATVTAVRHTTFGTTTCRYSTNDTHIGTLTGGNPATLKLEGKLPFHSGGGLCGEGTVQMTGSYVTTNALYVADTPATTLTSPTGTAVAPTVHLVNEGGHVEIANPIAPIECGSTMEATLEQTGSGTAAGKVSALSFSGCTNGWTLNAEAAGELKIDATSGYSGTMTWNGATLTAVRHTIFGTVECRYTTSNMHLGTLTGGNPATLKIESKIPFHSGGGLCGEGTSQMTGNYVTTNALYVDK